jgi:hypothetical protein
MADPKKPSPTISPEDAAELRRQLKQEFLDGILKPAGVRAVEGAVEQAYEHLQANPEGHVAQLVKAVDAGSGGGVKKLLGFLGGAIDKAKAGGAPPGGK